MSEGGQENGVRKLLILFLMTEVSHAISEAELTGNFLKKHDSSGKYISPEMFCLDSVDELHLKCRQETINIVPGFLLDFSAGCLGSGLS